MSVLTLARSCFPALVGDAPSNTSVKIQIPNTSSRDKLLFQQVNSSSEPDLLQLQAVDHRNRLTRLCRSVDWTEVRTNARAYFNLLLILAIVYLTIFCVVGEMALPGLYLILIWQAAHVGGFVFDVIRFPSILGMMAVGFLLRNGMGPILDPLP